MRRFSPNSAPWECAAAPLVLAFVLGPMLENNLRKSLIPPQGDLLTFVQRPISAACLVLAVAAGRTAVAVAAQEARNGGAG